MNQELLVNHISDDGQQISLYIPEDIDLILISLSGGADSALLLYLLCEYLVQTNRTHIKIIARHCVDVVWAPKTQACYDNILDQFDKKFPEIKIIRHPFTHIENRNSKTPVTKHDATRANLFNIVKSHPGKTISFSAGTCNPPKEVQDKYSVYHRRDVGRDIEVARTKDSYYFVDTAGNRYSGFDTNDTVLISRPFLLVNKKFVSYHYNKIDFLKEQIFHLTTSCVNASSFETNGWTKPCKECWWCKEKHWAFGKYDYEKLESTTCQE